MGGKVMQIDPAAVLALISSLTAQNAQLQAEIARLREEVAKGGAAPSA